MPEEVDTIRGGFYINSGSLEFKKLSNYERPGDEIRMPKARKRALSSSSESSANDAAEEDKAPEKAKKHIHAEKKSKTAATSSSDEQGKIKKLKKDKQEKPKEVRKEIQPVKEPEKKKPLEKEKEPEKVLKTMSVKDMLRAKRDSQRKIEQEKPKPSSTTTDNDDETGESETTGSIGVSESSRDSHPEAAVVPTNGATDLKLPENLPPEIFNLITETIVYCETNRKAKGSFFDPSLLDQLVNIDNSAKSLGTNTRIQMFNYLEQYVPCTRKTLLAKVRKHRVVQHENKVKNEINKLKKIVNETMPSLMTKYDQEVKNHNEMKMIQDVVGDSFQQNPPRKKYHWNDSSRTLLSVIVHHLQDQFKVLKRTNNEDLEHFVNRKLTELVVPLFPEGWIKPEDFRKELERKQKKQNRPLPTSSQNPSQVQPKANTASVASTNGKAPVQPQKTETKEKSNELDIPVVNGKSTSPMSLAPSVSITSVIKRSSDHSISSIISTSPSPPTTSQSLKIQDTSKARVIDLDKLSSPSELLKAAQSKTLIPKLNSSPIHLAPDTLHLDKVRRSDSSDSDCVEIVGEGEFNPIKPVKTSYHHNNNNKVNHSSPQHHAPVAKKSRIHGSDDGEHETDYSKIIMGIQSLTVRKFS